MRRWSWIGVLLLVIAGGVLVGVSAYNAGVTHGLEQTGRVVQVVRDGRGYGYFPFGLFLFPLFFIGVFLMIRGAFWSRRWTGHGDHSHGPGGYGPGRWGPGPWGHGGPQAFEEWHRNQHEQGAGSAASSGTGSGGSSPGGEPTGV